jgi:hypothetical protein
MGGRVLKTLCKTVTHVVWANGKLSTLFKANEMNLQIVSPLWLKACAETLTVADENAYRPANLEGRIEASKYEMAAKPANKKRPHPDSSQLKIFEKQGI